jgi:tetratricopeptide (TPR) repeat protein
LKGYKVLIRDFPANPDYRFRMARILNNYGNSTSKLGESERAIEAYRQGRDLLERVVDETGNTFHCYEYAASVANLAHALDNRAEHEAAWTEYQKGIAVFREVIREHPKVGKYRMELALGEGMLGNLLLRMNRPSESLLSRSLDHSCCAKPW